MNFRNLFRNSYVLFTAVRYLCYFILFIRGFFIAKALGPYYFGVWGLLALYLQYLSFSTLGIQYALNNDLAINSREDRKATNTLISSAFFITTFVLLLMFLSFVVVRALSIDLRIVTVGNSGYYILILLAIISFQNYQQLFNNIFRVYGRLMMVAIAESVVAVGTLVTILFFQEEELIYAFFICWAACLFLVNLLFLYFKPFEFDFTVSWQVVVSLLRSGVPLLIYNFSFYLIMISSRTIIGIFYSYEILGYYSLANNITTAILLGLDSIAWIFYPKILAKVKEGISDIDVVNTIKRVTDLYSTAVFMLIFIAIIFSPLIFIYLPDYKPLGPALIILLLTQGVFSVNFGFVSLAISRKKYYPVVFISLMGSLVTIGLGLLFSYFGFDFYWMAVSTFIGSFIFTIAAFQYSLRLLRAGSFSVLDIFPFSILFPLGLFFAGSFTDYGLLLFILGIIIFTILNRGRIYKIYEYVKSNL